MSPPASRRTEQGQAAVELALSLPVLAVLLAVLVQVGLVVRDQVLLVHAARETARELAVEEQEQLGSPADIARNATSGALEAKGLTVEATRRAGRVRVQAGYRVPIRLPLVRSVFRDVPIAANAEAKSEID